MNRLLLVLFPLLFSFSCLDFLKPDPADEEEEDNDERVEGDRQGDCTDGEDNDDDNFIDCEDNGCQDKPVCTPEIEVDTGDVEEESDTGDIEEEIDTDGDGVADEFDAFPNDPSESEDSDGDGLGDNNEEAMGTNPNSADTDGDGLSDSEELTVGTDPTNADSDEDGTNDGEEVAAGTDPTNPLDGGASILPNTGSWELTDLSFTQDNCQLEALLANFGFGVSSLVPTSFEIENRQSNSFDIVDSSGGRTCTLSGNNNEFSCTSITYQESIPSPLGLETVELSYEVSGAMVDPNQMTADLSLTLLSTDGILNAFINFPCTSEIYADGYRQ